MVRLQFAKLSYAGSIPAQASSKHSSVYKSSINGRLPLYTEEVRNRSWSVKQLEEAAKISSSFRQILTKLGLREAGGNYEQLKKYVTEFKIDISHFRGKAWKKGLQIPREPVIPLSQILRTNSFFQSYKLKLRLFKEGLKKEACEECAWANRSEDGRIPLELDHINGDRHDNRLENLRVLCPNCHSLKPTHRGKNKKARRDGETGRHATLKML